MRYQKRAATIVAIVACVLTTTVACSSAGNGNTTGGDNSAPAAEKLTGEITWYTAQGPEQNAATVTAFNKAYPNVKLNVLRLASGELTVRYAQERASNSSPADVVTVANQAFIQTGLDKKWWEAKPEVAPGWPASATNQGVAESGILPVLAAYNTDLIPAKDVPKSWKDLLDPSLKGKILFADPRASDGYLGLMEIWSEKYGDSFLTSFAAQNPRLVASVIPGNQTLGAGGASLLVPNAAPGAKAVIGAGAPVKLLSISPTTGSEYNTVIPTNAPNTKNAAAFYKFLTTKEGQDAFNSNETTVSLRSDTTGTAQLPKDYIPLKDVLAKANERKAELLSLLGVH